MSKQIRIRSLKLAAVMIAALLGSAATNFLLGAGREFSVAQQSPAAKSEKPFQLTSTAFDPDSAIPQKFACNGANISPALAWTDPPANTQSLALIVDDPDAPSPTPYVHWLIYAIPPTERALTETTPTKPTLPNGARQGKNSDGKIGYSGPCPGPGKVHHYFFKLYALDYTPDLKPKAKVEDVRSAVKGHTLAEAELIGRFQRE
ncbi:MAG TPA: YbhB/YbcL family Raf kinase inhibitor-like protein [Candidatus Acidoferrales bacterium]